MFADGGGKSLKNTAAVVVAPSQYWKRGYSRIPFRYSLIREVFKEPSAPNVRDRGGGLKS